MGNYTSIPKISAVGATTTGPQVAIGSVSVGEDLLLGLILPGFNRNDDLVNAEATLGNLTVKGDTYFPVS